MAYSGVAYDPEMTKEAKGKLKSLARQKPKNIRMPLRNVIEELRPEIDQAKAAGHTLDDIAIVLAECGVVVKAATLKQYLRDVQDSVKLKENPGKT